jgi:thymidylate kinase
VRGELAVWAAQYEVIVLEGCDGAGKTTVASRLASGCGYALVHSGRTPDGADLAERYRAILRRPGKLVLDRSFVSELVYGPLRHGGSRLSVTEAIALASIVAERNGVIVHLAASPEEIAARLRLRDGRPPALQEIRDLLDAYKRVFTALAEAVPIITMTPTA